MKILVTGGAGFIGSHLCERLVAEGHQVISLDNYFTGSKENHVEGVTYITGDTRCINNLKVIPEIIFHLGEYSRVEQSFEDMDKVIAYNKYGTYAIIEFAREHNCKLVYAGSSTKYGDIGCNSSPYAWSKASNSELVKNYGEWYNLGYAITYFYNVYGPREIATGKYATLIALFNEKMKNNEPLTVVAPGTQLRNFTHVDDIVDGLLLVGYNGYGDEYGIGHPDSYSVHEVAEMFGGEIEFLPERDGNRMTAKVISDKTRDLGWNPTRDLGEYILDLHKNFKLKKG